MKEMRKSIYKFGYFIVIVASISSRRKDEPNLTKSILNGDRCFLVMKDQYQDTEENFVKNDA